MSINFTEPTVIKGGSATDDRGNLSFINNLVVSNFKRFYTVQNHKSGFIRAWHGHLKESKALIVLKGSAIIGAVKMTDTKNPDKSEKVSRFVLTSSSPAAVFVPKGFANGFMTLTEEAIILIFSSSELRDSLEDDFRFEYDYWNPWTIEPR
jgi:dTDP-4-dehydrorhamnose 3,5-epimerase-like enzyme